MENDFSATGRRDRLIAAGREVARREAAAARAAGESLGGDFAAACELVLAASGRVICSGIGKSAVIARKLAATLASLGTPAAFLHAADAPHGDLGMIVAGDVVIVFSHSGTTAEAVAVAAAARDLGAAVIAVTDVEGSPLARAADVTLCPQVAEEADHLGLAPTASTTAAIVVADALAVAVASERGFSREDFARYHPGGALGEAARAPT